jgi:putative transposase
MPTVGGLPRFGLPPVGGISEEDCTIMTLIDRQYLARPYYGSRRMAAWLTTQGYDVNRKRVQRLMRLAGLVAIYQRPNTSKPAVAHKIYPTRAMGSRSNGSIRSGART